MRTGWSLSMPFFFVGFRWGSGPLGVQGVLQRCLLVQGRILLSKGLLLSSGAELARRVNLGPIRYKFLNMKSWLQILCSGFVVSWSGRIVFLLSKSKDLVPQCWFCRCLPALCEFFLLLSYRMQSKWNYTLQVLKEAFLRLYSEKLRCFWSHHGKFGQKNKIIRFCPGKLGGLTA